MKTIRNMLVLSILFAAVPGAALHSQQSIPEAVLRLWLQDDPADSLYRAARVALNAGDYRGAAEQFQVLRQRHPRSVHVADSFYWEALARSRIGGRDQLVQARRLLAQQGRLHRDAPTRRDGRELEARIDGELARLGDAEAAQRAAERAALVAPAPPSFSTAPRPPAAVAPAPPPPRTPRPPTAPRPPRMGMAPCADEDERNIAMSALLSMRAEQAVPVLRSVLERRDEGSACLRRKAVFILSQQRSDEKEDILLSTVRHDPDAEVREQAVFWLSQVNTERASSALDSILQRAGDEALQKRAIFALSQQRNPRAAVALRNYLERPDASEDLKGEVIFWLGQRRSAENAEFLRQFYTRTNSPKLKERVLFSVAQMGFQENARWLLGIAQNPREDIELRKNALFWAGEVRNLPIGDLTAMYEHALDRALREHLIFVYSQRREPEAVDQLMEIARTETDAGLRRNAIFWLGQSRDPRVAEFLLEIINR